LGLRQAYPQGYSIWVGSYEGGPFEPPPNFAQPAETVNGYGLSQPMLALMRGLEHTRNHIPHPGRPRRADVWANPRRLGQGGVRLKFSPSL
jgi:hypothetical protein